MEEKNFMEKFLEKEGASKKLWKIFYIGLGISVIIGVIVQYGIPYHYYFHFKEIIPAFYAIFGFIACLILLVGSKMIGKYLHILVDEDYYSKRYIDFKGEDKEPEYSKP